MMRLNTITCEAPACDGRITFAVPARHTDTTGKLGPVTQTARCPACQRDYVFYPLHPLAWKRTTDPAEERALIEQHEGARV